IVCTTIARTMAYSKIQRDRFVGMYAFDRQGLLRYAGEHIRDEDRIVPVDVVVFFDDPDKEFFTWYKPYNPKFLERLKERQARRAAAGQQLVEETEPQEAVGGANANPGVPQRMRLDNTTIMIEKINTRDYFVRPEHLVLGYALEGNRLVFTTTEELTRKLILYMYPNV